MTDDDTILSKNPYQDMTQFLDELETLNKNNQNEWDKTKQKQQDEINKVLDMLEDPETWPAFPKQVWSSVFTLFLLTFAMQNQINLDLCMNMLYINS